MIVLLFYSSVALKCQYLVIVAKIIFFEALWVIWHEVCSSDTDVVR